jgi:hypothetical protein
MASSIEEDNIEIVSPAAILKPYPQLNAIAEAHLSTIKLSVENAILCMQENVTVANGTLEASFSKLFKTFPQKTRNHANRVAKAYFTAPMEERTEYFGSRAPLVKPNVPHPASVRELVKSVRPVMDVTKLKANLPHIAVPGPQTSGPLAMTSAFKHLKLEINTVHCLEESFPPSGSDDISLGGTALALGDGTTAHPPHPVKVNFGHVGDFDEGTLVHVNKTFHTWSLSEGGNNWPKAFHAVVVLCEVVSVFIFFFMKFSFDFF